MAPASSRSRVASVFLAVSLFPLAGALQDFAINSLETERPANTRFLSENRTDRNCRFSCKYLPSLLSAYVIAVPQRRARAQQFLKEIGLDDIGVVHHATLKNTLDRATLVAEGKLQNETNPPDLSLGEIACTLSHFSALRTFLSDSHKQFAVIFEDDAEPEFSIEEKDIHKVITSGSTWHGALEHLIMTRNSTEHWDMLSLGRCWDHCCAKEGQTEGGIVSAPLTGHRIVWSLAPYCGHAYLISRKGAENLLDFGSPIKQIIDDTFVHAHWNEKLNLKAITPRLFKQEVIA
eukprot:1369570-Amorphochlora_amoeboformis.AAC.2